MQPNPHVNHVAHVNRIVHKYTFNDWVADRLGPVFGSMKMFWGLVIWQMTWIGLATAGISIFRSDKYPFVFLLFLSNLIQLWALPLLAYIANKADRKRDIKNDVDHEALTHIANQVDRITKSLNLADESI
jgi:uncharacterized membrane protein